VAKKKSSVSKKKTGSKPAKRAAATKAKSKGVAKPKRSTKKTVTKKAVTKKTKTKVVKKKKAASTKKSKAITTKKTTTRRSANKQPKMPDSGVLENPPKVLTESQLRKVKTGLTKRDLESYRQRLLKKRAEIVGDVRLMESDARNTHFGGNLSNVPVHMADIGSDNYEQEFTLGLVESERKLLMKIDEALGRINQRIYGVCLDRGVPIGRARLDAKPWAKYCIEVARDRERQGLN